MAEKDLLNNLEFDGIGVLEELIGKPLNSEDETETEALKKKPFQKKEKYRAWTSECALNLFAEDPDRESQFRKQLADQREMMTAMYALPETFVRSMDSGWFSVSDNFDLRKIPCGYDSIRCREGITAANLQSSKNGGSGGGMYSGWNSQLLRKLQDKFSFRLDHIRWLQELVLEHNVPTNITLHCNDFRDLRDDLEDSVIETLVGDKFIIEEKINERFRRFDHSSDPIEILTRADWFTKREVNTYSTYPEEEASASSRIPMEIGPIDEGDVEIVEKSDDSGGKSDSNLRENSPESDNLSRLISEETGQEQHVFKNYSDDSPNSPSEADIVDLERELLLKLTGVDSLTVPALIHKDLESGDISEKLKFKVKSNEEPQRLPKISRLGDRLVAALKKQKARKKPTSPNICINSEKEVRLGKVEESFRERRLSASATDAMVNTKLGNQSFVDPHKVIDSSLGDKKRSTSSEPSDHPVKLGDRLAAAIKSRAAASLAGPSGQSAAREGSRNSVDLKTAESGVTKKKYIEPNMAQAIDQIVNMVKVSKSTNSVIQVLKEFDNLKTLLVLLATKQSAILQQLVNLIRNSGLTLPPEAITALREKLLKFVMQNAIEVAKGGAEDSSSPGSKDKSGVYDPTNPLRDDVGEGAKDAEREDMDLEETDFTESLGVGKGQGTSASKLFSKKDPGPSPGSTDKTNLRAGVKRFRFDDAPTDDVAGKKLKINEILQKVEARRLSELKKRKDISEKSTVTSATNPDPTGSTPAGAPVSESSTEKPTAETVESLKAQVEHMKKLMEQMQQQQQQLHQFRPPIASAVSSGVMPNMAMPPPVAAGPVFPTNPAMPSVPVVGSQAYSVPRPFIISHGVNVLRPPIPPRIVPPVTTRGSLLNSPNEILSNFNRPVLPPPNPALPPIRPIHNDHSNGLSSSVLPVSTASYSNNVTKLDSIAEYQKYFQRPKPLFDKMSSVNSAINNSTSISNTQESLANKNSFLPRCPTNTPANRPSFGNGMGAFSKVDVVSPPLELQSNFHNPSPQKRQPKKPLISPRKLFEPYSVSLTPKTISSETGNSAATSALTTTAPTTSASTTVTTISSEIVDPDIVIVPSTSKSVEAAPQPSSVTSVVTTAVPASTISAPKSISANINNSPPALPSLLSFNSPPRCPTRPPFVRPVNPNRPASVFMTNLVHADSFSSGRSPFRLMTRPRPPILRPQMSSWNSRPGFNLFNQIPKNMPIGLYATPGIFKPQGSLNSEEELSVIDIIQDLAKDTVPGGPGRRTDPTSTASSSKGNSVDPEIVTITE